MAQILALQIEKLDKNTETLQEPALVIDFQQKRLEKSQLKIQHLWALDGIRALRLMIADYEKLMVVLADEVTPEQLAQFTPLTAAEQIQDDLRRLNTLVEALEYLVNEKPGLTLVAALEILREFGGDEMAAVIDYLLAAEYPVFKAMMKVMDYTSVGGEYVEVEEALCETREVLASMGAYDSVSGIDFLLCQDYVCH